MYIQPGGTLQQQGASLRGQPKFSGALVPGFNGSRIGVQSGSTALGAFDGPAQSMEVGGRWGRAARLGASSALGGAPKL